MDTTNTREGGEPSLPEDLDLASYYLFDRLGEGLEGAPAILFGDRTYTYGDVAQRTRELARCLIGAGVRREERVLTILHDVPAFAWSFFATLHLGAVVAMGLWVGRSSGRTSWGRWNRQ